MSTTFSQNLGIIEPAINDPSTTNSWGALWNTNAALIDSAITGIITVGVGGNTNVVLTSIQGQPDQSRNVTFILTGALTGNIDVLWPQGLARNFRVINQTTGAFTLAAGANNGSGSAAGTTFTVPQDGNPYALASDGTNVAAWLGGYLPLSGGTVNGNLAVTGTLTIGTNTGSELLTINGGAGNTRTIQYDSAGVARWVEGTNATAESGSNVGSDYVIQRFSDAGSLIDTPLTITRSTGIMSLSQILTFPTASTSDNSTKGATTAFVVNEVTAYTAANYLPLTGGTITGNLTVGNGLGGTVFTIDGAAGQNRAEHFTSGGVLRWVIATNNTSESGSNAGSNLVIQAFSDAGSILSTPISITRANGVVTFSATPIGVTPSFSNNSAQIATTQFVNYFIPVTATANAFAGTGSFVKVATVNVSPTGSANYLLQANIGQTFAGSATNWGIKFRIDNSTDVNSTVGTNSQTLISLMGEQSLGPGSHTIDLYWLGQNSNVNTAFVTLTAMPSN